MKRELAAIERILIVKKGEAEGAIRELGASEWGKAILAAAGRESGIRLRLQRDGRDVGGGLLLPGAAGLRIGQIVPGGYKLATATGRVLWERELTPHEVLSALAFSGEPLPAAAQTERFAQKPTVTASVADGALALRIYAGREAGALQCVLKAKR
jgi:hypothetical protein